MPHSFPPPSVLPDISPARGEIAHSIPLSPTTGAARMAPAAQLPISPLAGEMSGRTEGGGKDRNLANRSSATSHQGCSR
ncbi:MAG: hypothetical protein E5X89_19540 [Mesorhizobium sp.]|nr:MAG: hypothetical protein E5X88_06010 [Mesorhizobium sp.]TIO32481.1 MAG: hypothetical protein E5X89_19540 [Mesorhizobium sp.]